MARFFLAIVGLAYLLLGLWCAVAPDKSSAAVGFSLRIGQGQSEFLTVYGGLEVAIGLLFLWPLLQPDVLRFSLTACVMIHGCLVLFRTVGYFVFINFEATTYILSCIEWLIFLLGLALRSHLKSGRI